MTQISTTQETDSADFLARPLLGSLSLDWEKAIYGLFIIVAVATRFWAIGDRVMSHDESLHTQYSYQYYIGDGYQHTALMHGPSLFHVTALSYWLFGASDTSSRLPVAITGIVLVILPYFMRRWLGRSGALFTSFLLLISPMVTYHSRYIRHDVYIITFAVLTFIAIWHYLAERREKYLWWFTLGLALMFTTMETSFIYTAIFGSFLVIRLTVQIMRAPWLSAAWPRLRQPVAVIVVALFMLVGGFGAQRLLPRMLEAQATAEPTSTEQGFAADPEEQLADEPAAVGPAETAMGWLQVLGLVVLAAGLFMVAQELRPQLDQQPEFDLIVLTTTLVLPTVSPFLVRLVGGNPLDYSVSNCADPASAGVWDCARIFLTSPLVRTAGFVILTLTAGALTGLWWSVRRWLIAAAIFHAIFLLLFTSFFTNPGGWTSGMVGSLGYWLAQQAVERGNQPVAYYFFVVPLYEFLPLLMALAGTWHWLRRQQLNKVVGYWLALLLSALLAYSLANWLVNRDVVYSGDEPNNTTALIAAALIFGAGALYWFMGYSRQLKARYGLRRSWQGLLDLGPIFAGSGGDAFAFSMIWWILLTWVMYSWAGEKMPWLSTHFAVPMAVLGGWFFKEALSAVAPAELLSRRALRLAGLVAVFLVAATLALGPLLLGRIRLGSQEAADLGQLGRFVGGVGVVAAVLYLLYQWQRGLERPARRRAWLLGVVAVLSLLTMRFTYMSSFPNADYALEFMVYAHGAPNTKSVVLDQLESLSMRLHGDKSIKVAFDNDVSWPMTWYLRDYPNRIYFGNAPGRNITEAPIVIVGSENWTNVEPILGGDYEISTYTFLWWPMEKYRDISWNAIFGYDPLSRDAEGNVVRRRGLGDPAVRQALWDIFFYRDYDRYGQVFGGAYTTGQWPLRHDLRLYIRHDARASLWDYGATAAAIEPPVNPYAANELTLTPSQVIAGSDESGPLLAPRNLAIGPDGNLYVADSGSHRIQVFSPDGRYLRGWGAFGANPGEFNEPWGLAVDDSHVYVADTWNHRLQKFSLDGQFVAVFGQSGSPAEGDVGGGLFFGPRDVLVLPGGQLLVTDTGNHRMQFLDADSGAFIRQVGSFGGQLGQLNEPVGLDVGPDGSIYLADTWNGRIQKFVPDLLPILEWPVDAWAGESTNNKPYLAVDAAGRVYVTDPEGYRVLIFSGDGQYLARFGRFGNDLNSLGLPNGIAVDGQGNIWLADAGNNRILQFAPPFEAEPTDVEAPLEEGPEQESGGEESGLEPTPAEGDEPAPSPTPPG